MVGYHNLSWFMLPVTNFSSGKDFSNQSSVVIDGYRRNAFVGCTAVNQSEWKIKNKVYSENKMGVES